MRKADGQDVGDLQRGSPVDRPNLWVRSYHNAVPRVKMAEAHENSLTPFHLGQPSSTSAHLTRSAILISILARPTLLLLFPSLSLSLSLSLSYSLSLFCPLLL